MHPLVDLARRAVEEYIKEGKIIPLPDSMSPEMCEKAGIFVCLKKGGDLRGCIGTFMPSYNTVAEEVIHNAIAAATQDPRFHAVRKEELHLLTYTVDLLFPPEKIPDNSSLDPRRYGVIVVSGGRKGLLLPDLEGVDTVEEQIRIAKMKAGIDTAEDSDIYRFEVKRYH